MFFCAKARQWVKDVCIMRCATVECPCFHCGSDGICGRWIEPFTAFDGAFERAIDVLGKELFHLLLVEYIGVEKGFGGGALGVDLGGRDSLPCDCIDRLEAGVVTDGHHNLLSVLRVF